MKLNGKSEGSSIFSPTAKILALIPLLVVLRKIAYPDEPLLFKSFKLKDVLPSTSMITALLSLVVMYKVSSWILWWSLKRYCNCAPPELALQHFVRDSGLFHTLMAIMSLKSVKQILSVRPDVIWHSLRLVWRRNVFAYGYQSTSQFVEFFWPSTVIANEQKQQEQVEGVVVFLHGGAWGSGDPSMYRLLVLPFEKMNWATAIVGYRTYPEGDASSQVHDLEMAMKELQRRYPDVCRRKVCLMGHSSGAHISMLTIVERVRRKLELEQAGDTLALQQWEKSLVKIDSFIGVSGPYNIYNHFDFEAGRGVEQISPMQPACGNSREMFLRYSPAVQVSHMFAKCSLPEEQNSFSRSFPPMVLVHGMEDDTVPYSASKEAGRVLRASGITQCSEIYERDAGHEEAIMQVMIGGPVQDIIIDLLKEQ